MESAGKDGQRGGAQGLCWEGIVKSLGLERETWTAVSRNTVEWDPASHPTDTKCWVRYWKQCPECIHKLAETERCSGLVLREAGTRIGEQSPETSVGHSMFTEPVLDRDLELFEAWGLEGLRTNPSPPSCHGEV